MARLREEEQGVGDGLPCEASIALGPAKVSGRYKLQIDRIKGFGRNIAFVCIIQVNEAPCVRSCALERYPHQRTTMIHD